MAERRNLENLLEEFFTKPISNNRRLEIEKILEDWKICENNWQSSLEWLPNCDTNPYLSMFCLSTLEFVISKHWLKFSPDRKTKIRDILFQYSLLPRSNQLHLVTKKSIKLVVDIARIDWPHFYPEFFTQVLNLLMNSPSLGLIYLETISQELCGLSGRQRELSVSRNTELQRLILAQMPQLNPLIEKFLQEDSPEISHSILQILGHFFQWVPAQNISMQVVGTVFRLALPSQDEERSILALSALNEMLYRHWTPPCWPQFLQFTASFLESSVQHNLSDRYFEKISELIKLVLSTHMSRGAVNMELLLSSLFKMTETHENLIACLKIWWPLLEHPLAARFAPHFGQLGQFLLLRLQCRHHRGIQLSLQDGNEDSDDEPKSLNFCLDLFAKIVELEPNINYLISQWLDIKELIKIEARNELFLRDLAMLTRALGKVSPFWCPSTSGPGIVENLLELGQIDYSTCSNELKPLYISIHCEALAALKTSCYYLPQPDLYEKREKYFKLCIPALIVCSPESLKRLQHSCAHLFSTLTATVKSETLWTETYISPLYNASFCHLTLEDKYLVIGGLINVLVLPGQDPDGNRLQQLSLFVNKLTIPLKEPGDRRVLVSVLRLMKYVVELFASEGSKQKQLLCAALKGVAEQALVLFTIQSDQTDLIEEILNLFLTFLDCLQTQVGVSFVQIVVSTFLNAYSRERLEMALVSQNGAGIQQLLLILNLVTRTPAMSAAGLTPLTLELVMHLGEVLVLPTAPAQLQDAYFQLIASLIEHKWQFLQNNHGIFADLMRIMVASLLLPDINIFKSSLSYFEALNERRKLYRSSVFKREISGELVTVLLTTLINKTHELLADDIAATLCHFINADPVDFFENLLFNFLAQLTDLLDGQRQTLFDNFTRELDLPSVTSNLSKFVNEVICYRLCNQSR